MTSKSWLENKVQQMEDYLERLFLGEQNWEQTPGDLDFLFLVLFAFLGLLHFAFMADMIPVVHGWGWEGLRSSFQWYFLALIPLNVLVILMLAQARFTMPSELLILFVLMFTPVMVATVDFGASQNGTHSLLLPPVFSDDIYRYVWEGHVLANGKSPWSLPPNAPELGFLRLELPHIYEHINNADLSAIYPPLPQTLFALTGFLGGGIPMIRLLMWMAFCFALFLIGWREWRFGQRGVPAVLLLMHPIVFIAVYNSAHLDVLMLVGAAICFASVPSDGRIGRPMTAGVGLGLAVLTKFAPIVLLPHLMWQWKDWPARLKVAGACLLTIVLFYLPYSGSGMDHFRSLGIYNKVWEHNGFLYPLLVNSLFRISESGAWLMSLLSGGLGEAQAQSLLEAEGFYPLHPNQLGARLIGGIAFGVVWFAMLWRREDFLVQWCVVVGAGLLVSPVVHPWYLLALFPAIVHGGWLGAAALWWSVSIVYTYSNLYVFWTTGEWDLAPWIWWMQYGGMALIAVLAFVDWISGAAVSRKFGSLLELVSPVRRTHEEA